MCNPQVIAGQNVPMKITQITVQRAVSRRANLTYQSRVLPTATSTWPERLSAKADKGTAVIAVIQIEGQERRGVFWISQSHDDD